MKVSYFPGCTLRTKAKELDRCARACAEILGFELCEIENCCAAVKPSRYEPGSVCSCRRTPENGSCGAW